MADSKWFYSSECKIPSSSEKYQFIPPLLVNPCKGEESSMVELSDMQTQNLCGNSTLMRGSFRGQKCFMKVVDVKDKFFYERLQNEISVYMHLKKLQGTSPSS